MVFVVSSGNRIPDPLTVMLIPIPRLVIPDPGAVIPDPTPFLAVDLWSHIPSYDLVCMETPCLCPFQGRLRVVPHFSSGIVEQAKRERAWKSPHARKGGYFHARSRFARSTIPEEKWGTTRSLLSGAQIWPPETNRNNCFWVFLLIREFFSWGTHKD